MFKDKIKYLRIHQELSQIEVATKLGLTLSTYSKYENGIHPPTIEILKKLAELFDVSLDYLVENDRTISDSDDIVDLNSMIKELTDSKKVNYLDVYKKLVKNGLLNKKYTDDGVHLNEEGYAKVLNMISKVVDEK